MDGQREKKQENKTRRRKFTEIAAQKSADKQNKYSLISQKINSRSMKPTRQKKSKEENNVSELMKSEKSADK